MSVAVAWCCQCSLVRWPHKGSRDTWGFCLLETLKWASILSVHHLWAFPFNVLCPPYQLVPWVGWWCMSWGKFSLLISSISPFEQTGHLDRRPVQTNYKHWVWGGRNQSSFISAHWTWLKRGKADSKVIFSPYFSALFYSLSSHSSHQRKFKHQDTWFPLQLCLPRFLYAVEMDPIPSMTQYSLSSLRDVVGISIISHNI